MKNGTIVFFNKAKSSTKNTEPASQFKGHGFGILLGHVPTGAREPDIGHVLRVMGTLGFLSFDNVYEFLGKRLGDKVVKKFEAKFHGRIPPKRWWQLWKKKINPALTAPPVAKPTTPLPPPKLVKPSGLVDARGKPIMDMGAPFEP